MEVALSTEVQEAHSSIGRRMLFLSVANFGPGVVGKSGGRYKLYRRMEGCISLYLLRRTKNVELQTWSFHSSGSKISRKDIFDTDELRTHMILATCSAYCWRRDRWSGKIPLTGKLHHQDCVSDTEFVKDDGKGALSLRLASTYWCIRRTCQGIPVCV